jgi:hypothetical protein
MTSSVLPAGWLPATLLQIPAAGLSFDARQE